MCNVWRQVTLPDTHKNPVQFARFKLG